jgi:hypothetical protein
MDDFSPKESLIVDSQTITIIGKGFDGLGEYWCQFNGPAAQEHTTTATYIDDESIQCEKPMIQNSEDTHSLTISIYMSP